MLLELIDVKLYFQFCRPQLVPDLNFLSYRKKKITMNNHFKRKATENTFIKITFFSYNKCNTYL